LGKNQALDVFQTQTFSSDSKSTRLTFSESTPIGHMPDINIKDESYLILSKKSQELTTSVCGGENNIQPWKLHFHKWDESNPPQAFLWFDSIISLDGPPLLSNGIVSLELVFKEVEGGTQITLPLKGLDFSTDYYIILETPQQCDPIATFTFEVCNTSNQQPNAVTLRVNDEGLNAEVLLLNSSTAERHSFIMLQNNAQITDLPSGQYELIVRSNDATLVDKVFWLDACEGMPNGNTTGPVFNQFADPISDPSAFNAQTSHGIVAYPNPLQKQGEVAFHFWGFETSEFSIQVTDQSGRIVHTSTYNYTEGTAPFSYFFSQTGVYNVTLSSPNYTEVKRIVVQ
jgi:hypothetical protein